MEPAATFGPEPDEEALAAFIGPFWNSYYRGAFADQAAGRRRFNVTAALAPFWLSWRGFIGFQTLSMIAYGALTIFLLVRADSWNIGDTTLLLVVFGLPYLIVGIPQGLFANSLLRNKAETTWIKARAGGADRDTALKRMRKRGGGSVVNVIVMPVLACLLIAAFPFGPLGHHHDHSKAYVAAMKSDLRNLITAEESYFADHSTYTAELPRMNYQPSTGVTIYLGAASGTGWNATATHEAVQQMCAIFVGGAPSPVEGANEGEPKCEPHRH